MARGKQTATLEKQYVERLQRFKSAPHDGARYGYNLVQLRNAMSAPFMPHTLKKALSGQPVWERSYSFIVQWIDRYLPPNPPAAPAAVLPDHKMAAAGDRQEA